MIEARNYQRGRGCSESLTEDCYFRSAGRYPFNGTYHLNRSGEPIRGRTTDRTKSKSLGSLLIRLIHALCGTHSLGGTRLNSIGRKKRPTSQTLLLIPLL